MNDDAVGDDVPEDKVKLFFNLFLQSREDAEGYIWMRSEQNERISEAFIAQLVDEYASLVYKDSLLEHLKDTIAERLGELLERVLAQYPELTTMSSPDYEEPQFATFIIEEGGIKREVTAPILKASSLPEGCTRCGKNRDEEIHLPRGLYCTGGGCYCVDCLFTLYSRHQRKHGPELVSLSTFVDWLAERMDSETLSKLVADAAEQESEIWDVEVYKRVEDRDPRTLQLAESLSEFLTAAARNGFKRPQEDGTNDEMIN